MADPVNSPETPPAEQRSGTTIVQTQQSTETLGNKGETLPSNTNLSNIFDKIASGKPAEEAVKEVMHKKPDPVVKKEDKPAEQATEPKEASSLEKKLNQAQNDKEKLLEKEREEGDAREALRRERLSKAPEKPAEQKPAEQKSAEELHADDVTEDELKVLPADKPKTAKRIQSLLNRISSANELVATTKKEVDLKAAKLAELEQQLSQVKTVDPKVDEAVKQQLDELQMYRRQYEIDHDPAVKARFDDRIAGSDKPINDILKRNRAGEDLLKAIDDEGGWFKFASSSRNFSMKDGRNITAAELADEIVQSLPIMDRKAVEASVLERIQLTRDKERFVQEEKGKAQEYFKQREEQVKTYTQNQQKQIEDARKSIEQFQKEAFEKQDFLKEKPIPSDATAEQKVEIEEDNRYTKQLGQLLKQSVSTSELPKILDMVMDSVKYYDERRNSARLAAKVTALEKAVKDKDAEIAKIKTGSRSTTRSGSIAGGAQTEIKRAVPAKNLEEALNRIANGQRPDGTAASDDE